MATSSGKTQWHASYWDDQKHGGAWDRVKEALKRDWSQTKADVHAPSGKQLKQGADDTVKQAVGSAPIPPPDMANATGYEKIEPAISYGFAAHQEYGQKFTTWDEKLESKLSTEWDATKTGMNFEEAKPFVRRGWDYRK